MRSWVYVFRYAGMMEQSVAEYRTSQRLDTSYENRIAAERQIIKALIYSGRYDEAFEAYDSILEWLTALGRTPDEKVQFYQGLGPALRRRSRRCGSALRRIRRYRSRQLVVPLREGLQIWRYLGDPDTPRCR